jgi:hypothetical protein
MQIKNDTDDIRTTWSGVEIQPGETLEVEDLPDDELDWLCRHGCSVGGEEKTGGVQKKKGRKKAGSSVTQEGWVTIDED